MVKVHYDPATGEVKGFYPDDVNYASIPAPVIEVSHEVHLDCINHPGLRRVDVATATVVPYEPPATGPVIVEAAPVDPDLLAIAEALAAQDERLSRLEVSK